MYVCMYVCMYAFMYIVGVNYCIPGDISNILAAILLFCCPLVEPQQWQWQWGQAHCHLPWSGFYRRAAKERIGGEHTGRAMQTTAAHWRPSSRQTAARPSPRSAPRSCVCGAKAMAWTLTVGDSYRERERDREEEREREIKRRMSEDVSKESAVKKRFSF